MQQHNSNSRLTNNLLVSTFLLVSLGVVALYAASAMKGDQLYQNSFYFVEKQSLAILIGILFILIFKRVPFSVVERLNVPLLLLTLTSLSLIFVPGAYKTVGGATRWLSIGPINFQTSELAKISLIFFLSKNLSRPKNHVSHFLTGILPNLIVLIIFSFFLMLQPDFGTTALLVMITFFMIYISGATYRFVGFSTLGCVIAGVLGIVSAPYRWRRVTSFLNPWDDFKSSGFQIIQSYLGFQNGGALGAGLGESRQKLFFLPEAHTDFILSVIGEEFGFLGTVVVCFLYLNIIRLGFAISQKHICPFKKLLSFGLTCLIGLQSSFNIGVVMGILPTKGIPLPFISSGRSSLLVFFFAIAILARLGQEIPSHEQFSKV